MASIVSTLGAGSGIDTRALIDELVTAEKTSRTTPLNARAITLDAQISALAQVRSGIQTIATSLDARLRTGSLGLVAASSDSGALGLARFGIGPTQPFAAQVTVNRLASAQQLRGPALAAADAPVGIGTLTFQFGTRADLGGGAFSFAGSGSSVDIVIDATNNSLVGLRDAINRSNYGITAAIVSNAGSATLTLRGAEGAGQGFVVSVAGDADLARFAHTPGIRAMTLVGAAGDAELTVDGIAVTRPGNTIDDLFAGTRLQLKKADPMVPVTLSAARDGSALSATMGDVADTLGAMRGLIADLRKGATDTAAAGALSNDPMARSIDQRIAALVTSPFVEANGLRLRDLGVDINRDGTIGFDAARFAALSPTRYGDAEALLRALVAPALPGRANRLQSIAAQVTPASAGLTLRRTAVTRDLARVDTRLATYRANLVRQYSAMDTLVAASKAVQAQLDQQIAAWNNQKN